MDENSTSGGGIRTGSPFAIDPPSIAPPSAAQPSGSPLSDGPLSDGSLPDGEEPIVARYATGSSANEILDDAGPLCYTALGALAASLIVILFAAVGTWWFPAGGALIAALGCLLAIFGLFSTYRISSAVLIVVHLGLFVVSYSRSLS